MRRPLVAAMAVLALVLLVPLASSSRTTVERAGAGSASCAPDLDTRTNGDGSITLTWTGIPGAPGYVVRRAETGDEPAEIARLGPDATAYRDETTRVGATYQYVVHAAGAVSADACAAATASSISYTAGFVTALTVILAALGGYVVVRTATA